MPAGSVDHWPNPYPAISVPQAGLAALLDLIASPTQDTALHIRHYHESVSERVVALVGAINDLRARCQARTRIVLAGYSQGANVTADVYESLDADQRAIVFAVALFADLHFNGRSQANRGDYNPHRHGLLTFPSLFRKRPESPDVEDGKVLNFCHAKDPVCQGLLPSFDSGQHLNYHTFGDAASPVPYTERAADCIAHRAGHPDDPGAQVAKITPVGTPIAGEEFELAGEQSLDPACEPLLFSWNVDGAGFDEPTTSPTRTVSSPAGSHTVVLKVATTSDDTPTTITALGIKDEGFVIEKVAVDPAH